MKKHPMGKIFESGADPIDRQAHKGMTNRPGNALDHAVDRIEAQAREKKRREARFEKHCKDLQQKFRKQLYSCVYDFRDISGRCRLPFAIHDPTAGVTLVPPDCNMLNLIDDVHQAFKRSKVSDVFPFTILDAETAQELVPAFTIPLSTATRILQLRTFRTFQTDVMYVVQHPSDPLPSQQLPPEDLKGHELVNGICIHCRSRLATITHFGWPCRGMGERGTRNEKPTD